VELLITSDNDFDDSDDEIKVELVDLKQTRTRYYIDNKLCGCRHIFKHLYDKPKNFEIYDTCENDELSHIDLVDIQ